MCQKFCDRQRATPLLTQTLLVFSPLSLCYQHLSVKVNGYLSATLSYISKVDICCVLRVVFPAWFAIFFIQLICKLVNTIWIKHSNKWKRTSDMHLGLIVLLLGILAFHNYTLYSRDACVAAVNKFGPYFILILWDHESHLFDVESIIECRLSRSLPSTHEQAQ